MVIRRDYGFLQPRELFVQDVAPKATIIVLLGLCDVSLSTTDFVRLFVYSSAVAVGFSASEQQSVRYWTLRAYGGDGKSRRMQREVKER